MNAQTSMSAQTSASSRGALWLQALTGQTGMLAEGATTVRVATASLGFEPAIFIAEIGRASCRERV